MDPKRLAEAPLSFLNYLTKKQRKGTSSQKASTMINNAININAYVRQSEEPVSIPLRSPEYLMTTFENVFQRIAHLIEDLSRIARKIYVFYFDTNQATTFEFIGYLNCIEMTKKFSKIPQKIYKTIIELATTAEFTIRKYSNIKNYFLNSNFG